MKFRLVFQVVLALLFCTQLMGQKIPKFELTDIKGKTFSHEDIYENEALIVITHLGCPPGMQIVKDLQEFADTLLNDSIKIFLVLENTQKQFEAFTSDSNSSWFQIRKYFQIDKTFQFNVVAECEKPNKKYSDPKKAISYQCRGLKSKFKSKSSPTIILTTPAEGIILKERGYTITSNAEKIKFYHEKLKITTANTGYK